MEASSGRCDPAVVSAVRQIVLPVLVGRRSPAGGSAPPRRRSRTNQTPQARRRRTIAAHRRSAVPSSAAVHLGAAGRLSGGDWTTSWPRTRREWGTGGLARWPRWRRAEPTQTVLS